ncbi:glycosylphosphatidylinositol anchor biosynthesis protein 11 [Teleopsis dalmanni]|uniref:glycosylphosphatidylinositol anchor biosynthesis protein 11 n=1 Tax=Teleopsis dalmanni TaxID=139649 RepID=UPI0018CC8783|nr:glycosylphosphatidylinositol anchor biosynthesis protein 11 [Teleopsis dalmanni]
MPKFDQQKTKQQLFHLSISFAIILICMTYMHYLHDWSQIGNLWSSLIVPVIFIGEILKVILARYYIKFEDSVLNQKQRQKKTAYFSIRELSGGLLLQFLSTLLISFLCIILGAPVLQNYEQTFVLSLLITLLTVSPTVMLLGAGGALQVCFCEKPDFVTKSEETALHLFKYNAIGAILGAWAGSVVAPLDWDRDWQVYPVPNVVGALLGTALCNIYACSHVLLATAKVYLNMKRS